MRLRSRSFLRGSADGDDRGGGHARGVGERDEPAGDAELGGDFGGLAVELQEGLTEGVFLDFDIGPLDSEAEAGAEGFEDGLFRAEPCGVMERCFATVVAVGLFVGGEAAGEEAVAVIFEELLDALDAGEIDAVADDLHGGIIQADEG